MAAAINHIPQLESGNFENWLYRIEIALDEKGIRDLISKQEEDDVMKKNDFQKQDAKARNTIIQGLPDKYLEYVKGASTAYEMVEKLKKAFQRKSTLSSLCLKRQLINLQCQKDDNVQEHINKFDKLVQEISSHGIKIDEKEKVCQFLLSIEQAYQPLVTALEMSDVDLTMEFVRNKLLDAEIKGKDH